MTTKARIAEQVQRIYARYVDKDNPSDVIDIREVRLLVEQAINAVLKLQVAEYFKAGMIDVPKCNIISYSCPVTSDPSNNRAYITLPAIPLTLPMDMGVWSIHSSDGAVTPYIPLPSQDVIVFQGTNLSYLEGKVGYYVQGKRVYFTKNITLQANGSINSVVCNLLVMDFTQFADNDMLPISPEVEQDIIQNVLQSISNGRVSQAELNIKQE